MTLAIPGNVIPSFTELIIELSLLFARDETENANLKATDLLKTRLEAEAAALFYEDGRGQFRFCLAGADFPISLPESRWKECIEPLGDNEAVTRFGPWSIPGFDREIAYWIAIRLYSAEGSIGFILLGRSDEAWPEHSERILPVVSRMIESIADIRIRKARAERQALLTEERFQSLFEASPDMIYTADAQDRFTSINKAGLRLLGIAFPTDILGQKVETVLADPECRPHLVERALMHGDSAVNELILRHGPGESPLFCLESLTIIRRADGSVREFQGIVKDITQRMLYEQELQRSNLEMVELTTQLRETQTHMVQQEKLASIGQLAAGVAHEINNPLGFLKSNQATLIRYLARLKEAWSEFSRENPEESGKIEGKFRIRELFEELDSISEESEEGFNRIIRIVNGLRSFSRIDQTESFEEFDVEKGLDNTLTVAWNEIKYVADVKKRYGGIPPVMAHGNEINQVFLNVLVNAAQAIASQNRKEKGIITVTTSQPPHPAGTEGLVRIAIEDDGPGIPEGVKKRIFEPFFTTKAPGEGTGLGLNISYNIVVKQHGGALRAESPPQGGTRFVIELPLHTPEELPSAAQS